MKVIPETTKFAIYVFIRTIVIAKYIIRANYINSILCKGV